MSAPRAPGAAAAPPPPAAGTRLPWPPPPGVPPGPNAPYGGPEYGAPQYGASDYGGSAPAEPQLSDTVERMLRPQGLFQGPQSRLFDWRQAYAAPAQAPQPGSGQPPASGFDGTGYQAPGQYGQPTYPGSEYGGPTEWGGPSYGPGQYPSTDFGNAQYAQGQFGPGPSGQGQFGQGQYPPGQYPPAGQYAPGAPGSQFGPAGQFGPGTPPAAGGQRSLGFGKVRVNLPKGPLVPAIVAATLVVVVAVAVVLVVQTGSHSGSGSGSGTGAGAGSTPTATSSASALAEQQAATQLAGLLPQSGNDRSDVIAAVENVQACKDLPASAREFSKAATNRRALVTKLAQLPGRSALPAALVADLKGGWQASATADADLAKWASKAATGGCHKGNSKDPNLNASYNYDGIATSDKTAFVKLWDSLARKDGLPTYTADQL